jgi:uncharacterized protein (TIGR03067 family)
MTRLFIATVGAWIAVSSCLAADKAALVEAERAKLRGTWQLVSAEANGKQTPVDVVAKIRVVIAGNTHSVYLGDKALAHDVAWHVDPTTDPKSTTDTINDGPDKGKQIRGIYRLEGDTLTSCVGPVDGPRPTEFSAGAGSGQTLRIFRRVKDETKAEAVRAEMKRFEGTWRFVSMEMNGKAIPVDALKDSRLVFDADRFTSRGGETGEGRFVVDPTVRPKTIDITLDLGPGKTATILGIYELEGDTYRICSALFGKSRPTDFSTGADSGRGLSVMTREKP